MRNEEPSKLQQAIKQAALPPQSTATQDMKYCMIANFGVVGLESSERASLYVKNPQIETTAGMIKYVESGLSDNDFAYHVADVLQRHFFSGNAADLKKVVEGCFSVSLSPSAVYDVKNKFPLNRMIFLEYDNHGHMEQSAANLSLYMKGNSLHPQPYLDS